MPAASPRITFRRTANRSSSRAATRSMTWSSFADSGDGDRRRAGIDHANDRARAAENDLIAVFERDAVVNPLAVDERPVLAREVFDGDVRPVDVDARVIARHIRRADEVAANDVLTVGEVNRFVADLQPRGTRPLQRSNKRVALAVHSGDDLVIVIAEDRAQL